MWDCMSSEYTKQSPCNCLHSTYSSAALCPGHIGKFGWLQLNCRASLWIPKAWFWAERCFLSRLAVHWEQPVSTKQVKLGEDTLACKIELLGEQDRSLFWWHDSESDEQSHCRCKFGNINCWRAPGTITWSDNSLLCCWLCTIST